MPVYEYRCNYCGNIIEVVQKTINDKPETVFCEKCKGDLFIDEEVIKLISLSSFKLNFNTNY